MDCEEVANGFWHPYRGAIFMGCGPQVFARWRALDLGLPSVIPSGSKMDPGRARSGQVGPGRARSGSGRGQVGPGRLGHDGGRLAANKKTGVPVRERRFGKEKKAIRYRLSLDYSAATGSCAEASAAAWSRSQARRDIFTRPFSSTPRHLAVMTSPFLTMSSTFSVRPSASSET